MSTPRPGAVGSSAQPSSTSIRAVATSPQISAEIDEILGDPEIRDHRADMRRRRQPHQDAIIIVRGHHHRVRLRHHRNVHHRRDPADRADIGIEDVGRPPFQHLGELLLRVQRLAGDDRDRHARRTSASSSILSARHGSSYHRDAELGSRCPMLIACDGENRRWASIRSSKSGPTASRMRRTKSIAKSSSFGSRWVRHGPGNGSNFAAVKPIVLQLQRWPIFSSISLPCDQPLA